MFYSRTDVWEELDDYPEVIRSSFLMLKQSARTVFVYRCLVLCFEEEGDSSVISFRVGKRESVTNRSYVFRIRVWKDNVLDFFIFGGGVIQLL